MTIDVSPIPNFVPHGLKTLNVILFVRNIKHALEFYNRAFNAIESMRLADVSGKIIHAEIKINDTIIMLEETDYQSGSSVVMQLYVGDVEGFIHEAIKAGCEEVYPIREQLNGDRAGRIKDLFGHHWIISTHMEDVTPADIQKRLRFEESRH